MVTSKSDKETVIEMGPVNNEKKFRLLTYGSFFLSFSIVIISILFFYWITNFYMPKQINSEYSKFYDLLDNFENTNKSLDKEFDKIKQDFISLSDDIKNIDLQKDNNKKIISDLENLNNVNTLLQKKINSILDKLSKVDKKENNLEQLSHDNSIVKKDGFYETTLKLEDKKKLTKSSKLNHNKIEVEKFLIKEANIIIERLLKRKDLGLTSHSEIIKEGTNYFNKITNYLAGVLKLREFGESSSPRYLITKAEKELKNGNIKNVITLLKQLPENWKSSINEYISRADQLLNKNIK
jgi:hypothetical protein